MPEKQGPADTSVSAKEFIERMRAGRKEPAADKQEVEDAHILEDAYIFSEIVRRLDRWASRLSPIPESGEFQEYWDSQLTVYDVIQFIGCCLSLIPDYRSDAANLRKDPELFQGFVKKWGAFPCFENRLAPHHLRHSNELHHVIVPGFEIMEYEEEEEEGEWTPTEAEEERLAQQYEEVSDYPSLVINPNLPERLLTGHVRRERSRNARAAFKPAPRMWRRDLALYEQYKNNQQTQNQLLNWWNGGWKPPTLEEILSQQEETLEPEDPEDNPNWISDTDVVRKALNRAKEWVEKERYRDFLPKH